jgi:alpha-L-fucosidase 2
VVDCGIRDTEPAAAWQDAFLTGNGRHGAMAYGDPHDETVVINHHRLIAPNGSERLIPPPLADRLGEVRDLLLAGKSSDALDRFSAGWPENVPQPFHPAFAIRLRLRPAVGRTASGSPPGDAGTLGDRIWDYQRAADFSTGVLTTAWRDSVGGWRRTCFVSRARDVVVQRLQPPPGADASLEIDHEVLLPGAPRLAVSWLRRLNGRHSAVIGLRAAYPAAASAAPARSGEPATPAEHGGYCGATRIEVPGGECVLGCPVVRIRGATAVLLVTRVESLLAGDDPDARLSTLIWQLSCLPADHGRLLAEHVRMHRRAFGRTRIDLGASPADRRLGVTELLRRQAADPAVPLPALLEKLFDSGRYLLLCASGSLPPRLSGLWQGDWHAAWSGAITTNANLNLQLAGAVTTGVPAAIHALADLIAAQLTDWRVNASRIYGARGILAPAHTDGSSGLERHFAAAYPHHMWTAGADWLLVPLLDYADATGDERFLRERVLPALTELALFYEDFLAAADDEGNVVFAPSYSPENRPVGWTAAAVNATMDIAAARHALSAAAAACTRLGIEGGPGEGVERWRALLGRLPAYRVNGDGALAEWAWPPDGPGVGDQYDHRHVSHLYPAWPLHEATAEDNPALAEAALRALGLRGAQDGSAHGYLHRALAAARLRDAGLAGQQLAAITGQGFFFRSLMSSHYPGRRVYNADAACCLPAVLTEMLIDSVPPRDGRPGRVELLPAAPVFLSAGQLRGVRTLTQVDLDLTWDLKAGVVAADLRSRIGQQIELTCRGAVARHVADCRAQVAANGRRPGSWHLELPAGAEVHVTMETG